MFQEVETKEREEISFTDSRNMNLRQRLLAVAQMQLDNEAYSGEGLDPYGFLVEPEDPLRVAAAVSGRSGSVDQSRPGAGRVPGTVPDGV